MEMEFKDNSRRRTLVLVVGVLLAILAGAAAFFLSSQGTEEPTLLLPTREIVVAANEITARESIDVLDLTIRAVPVDDTNATAFTDRDLVVNQIAAIDILPFQPISPNMLASGSSIGAISILKPTETITPTSPILRAVSLTVPSDRAVGGLVAAGQRVDLIATIPITVNLPLDPETGEPLAVDPETGAAFPYVAGSSTKLMWLDAEILVHAPDSDSYIFRMDLQTAEEVAHAQNQGAAFTMVLRPDQDTRDIDRSSYGETTDRLLTRYNFAIPELIDGVLYEQPVPFPSPFPAEPYLSPPPSPSPSPESALVEIPLESPAP
jgi:Flp pilus assembly protein CpaB